MIKCIIVEDEPLAADVLKDYIDQVPFLKLVAILSDAIFAMDILKKEKIDLMFLDIHLPGLSGIEMLPTLTDPPQVILTTAYHEYALQGYNMNVVDYLLKPIEFNRFLQAVNKVKLLGSNKGKRVVITINSEKKKIIVHIDRIVYIESQKEYIHINTDKGEVYVTKYPISKIESELDSNLFLRIHRSFLIALPHIKAFNTQEVQLPEKVIPIGRNYKESVMNRLNEYF